MIRFVEGDFVDAEDDVPTAPAAFWRGAAFPNLFATTTTVLFETDRSGRVRLTIFDVLGRRDHDLDAGEQGGVQ